MSGRVHPGPLEEDFRRRLAQATGEAESLLGIDPDQPARDGSLETLIAGLGKLLSRSAGDRGPRALLAEHDAALQRSRVRFETRFEALGRVGGAIAELREITAPAAMLDRAPAALCAASNFSRALLSLVSDGQMIAQAAHFIGDRARAEQVADELRAAPVALEHPLIETELLRRRRATIVVDAQLHPRVDRRLAELMQWSSYAAAPLMVGTTLLGVVHADRGPDGRLDVLDRDVLWEFSSALAQAYESASLRRTLRREREQMRQFLEWLGARSGELTDAPVKLSTVQRPPRVVRTRPDSRPGATRDDRAVFEGLLTRRELDVLRLLADGRTNKAIAEALTISDGTVKFHVNSILRKLHVANRAEAVSRYLRLLGMRSP